MMKKILALTLLLGSSVMFVPSAEAKTAENNSAALIEANAASPQTYRERRRWNQRWNRRGARVVTRTRIVRSGYRTYREVIKNPLFAQRQSNGSRLEPHAHSHFKNS